MTAIICLAVVANRERLFIVEPPPTKQNTYALGIISPVTGDYAEWGQYFNEGVKIALSEIASRNDKFVPTPIFEDSKSTVKGALASLNSLLNRGDERPQVVLLMDSEAVKASAPVATEKNCLLIATLAGGPDLFALGQLGFRWYQNADSIGTALARHATSSGYQKLAILNENHPHSIAVKDSLVTNFQGGNRSVTLTETFDNKSASTRDQAAKILATSPDCIAITGTGGPAYVSFVRSVRELGWNGPILCDDAMNLPNMQNDVGQAGNGIVFTASPFNPSEPRTDRGKKFVVAFENEFGRKPTEASAYTYELTMLVHELNNEGYRTSKDIAEEIKHIKDRKTVFGDISYESGYEISVPMVLFKVEHTNGEMRIIEVVGEHANVP
jgi:ABC-type branched-subunit amino acid transport system substrate-binding protein